MKKIIAINCLILLGHFPYISTRWMDLPYVPTTFYLEDFMGFGAMLMGPLLLINTLALILFHSKSSNWKKQSLHFSIFILLGLLLFSLYVAVLITVDGRVVWIDCIAFLIYYVAFRWHRQELEKCTS